MPKIINNPLREGLSSKIYLLAYNGPITGYKIAERIHGKKAGSTPQTAKIYEWSKKLNEKKALKITQKGYISAANAVLPDIRQLMLEKGIEVSDLEMHMLEKVMDGERFRNRVEYSFYYEKSFFKGDIDAARQILHVLGDEALFASLVGCKTNDFRSQKEFDLYWNTNSDCSWNKLIELAEDEPAALKLIEEFRIEEEYFIKTNRIKQGGFLEKGLRNQTLACEGKKVKRWMETTFVELLPTSLIDRICKTTPTYELFQRILSDENRELLEMWLKRKKQ